MGMTFARVFTDDATSGGGVMPGNAAEVVEVGRPFWWIPSVKVMASHGLCRASHSEQLDLQCLWIEGNIQHIRSLKEMPLTEV